MSDPAKIDVRTPTERKLVFYALRMRRAYVLEGIDGYGEKYKLVLSRIESKVYDKQVDLLLRFKPIPTKSPIVVREGDIRVGTHRIWTHPIRVVKHETITWFEITRKIMERVMGFDYDDWMFVSKRRISAESLRRAFKQAIIEPERRYLEIEEIDPETTRLNAYTIEPIMTKIVPQLVTKQLFEDPEIPPLKQISLLKLLLQYQEEKQDPLPNIRDLMDYLVKKTGYSKITIFGYLELLIDKTYLKSWGDAYYTINEKKIQEQLTKIEEIRKKRKSKSSSKDRDHLAT